MAMQISPWVTLKASFLVAGVCISTPAYAERDEDPWYEVELIIFEHTRPEALLAEKWPLEPGFPDGDGLIELRTNDAESEETAAAADADTAAQPEATDAQVDLDEATETKEPGATEAPLTDEAFRPLDSEFFNLASEYSRLEKSPQHRPLLHTGWRMQVPSRATPARIRLSNHVARLLPLSEADTKALMALDMTAAAGLELDEVEPLAPLIAPGMDLDLDNVNTLPPIDGVISISVARYLHVDLDVLFRSLEPLPSDEQDIYMVMPEPIVEEPLMQSETDMEPVDMSVSLEPPQAQVLINDLIRVQGNLRMRSKEVHYLDHPKVGMIIQFLPYEPINKAESTSAEE